MLRCCLVCAWLLMTSLAAWGDALSVSAAVSLREALTQVSKTYQEKTGVHVELTFGASGQLSAQIINGAPVDAFISASQMQIEQLDEAGCVLPGSRRVIAGNELVLIVPHDQEEAIDSFEHLNLPSVRRLAIGEPATVPAGEYAMQVLDALKLADVLKGRIVYGANVRQVLDYISRGEVSAGIVYKTDAKTAGQQVKVAATAAAKLHSPIVYPGVVVRASKHAAESNAFLEYLLSEPAQRILAEHGFTAPEPATKPTP